MKLKKFILIILPFLIHISCKEKCEYDYTEKAVNEYIDYFKSLSKIKERKFIVKINIDSTQSKYEAYRISTYPQLLDENELPNRVEIRRGMKIAYFTENILDEDLRNKQILDLREKGFYNTDSVNFLSNYPQWVLIKKKNDRCFKLVKNANYKDLIKIIEKVKKNN